MSWPNSAPSRCVISCRGVRPVWFSPATVGRAPRGNSALGTLTLTPEQADDGLVELDLPDGGRVLVCFSDEVATNSEIEASVVLMMLAATGNEDDVRAALADYAEASGLTATVTADAGAVTVVIG